jgi:hypothetical protein
MMSNVVSLWYLVAFSAAASYVAMRGQPDAFGFEAQRDARTEPAPVGATRG